MIPTTPSQTPSTSVPYLNLDEFHVDEKIAINQYTAQKFISYILSPYFMSFLGSYILGPILAFIIYPIVFQKPVPPISSPMFMYLMFIFILIASGILLVFLSIYYAQKNNVNFFQSSPLPTFRIILAILTFTGLGLASYYFFTYAFKILAGPQAIIPSETASIFTITGEMQIFVALSVHFTYEYRFLILVGIALQYIGMTFVYRGLATRGLEQWNVKTAGIILLPALAETILFNFNLLFQTDITYATYMLLIWFFWSFFSGILYWYTKSVKPVIAYSLLLHYLLPNDPLQLAVYYNFPEWLGEYDPYKAPVTFVDKVALFSQNLSLFIIILSFFIPFLSLGVLGNFFVEFYKSMKTQGKGIGIVLIMFIALEVIFYYTFRYLSGGAFGFILALIIGMFLVSMAFRAIGRFLPKPTQEQLLYYAIAHEPVEKKQIPLNPRKDIETLQKPILFKEKSMHMAITLPLIELYLYSFTNAYQTTYLIFQTNNTIQILAFLFYNYLIPLGFLAFIGYSLAKFTYYQPLFYSSWQRHIERFSWFLTLSILFSFTVWTSLGVYHIRTLAFTPLFIKIILKPDTRDLNAKIQEGLAHENRYQTILFLQRNYTRLPEIQETLEALKQHENRLISGIVHAILCLQTSCPDEKILHYLRNGNDNEKYGILLYLGINAKRSKTMTQILVSFLKESDYSLAYLTLWALGKIGVPDYIPRIERFMWRVANPELQSLARMIIKEIDPDYPLISEIQEDMDFINT